MPGRGFEQRIDYSFKDKEYLETALTHSSYANEMKKSVKNNERFEFLGDSVLSVVVSEYLFRSYKLPEGELTRLRASLVCERSLYGFANQIELGEELKLGRGEDQMGGRQRTSILADAFEALIAAIYLDGGLESARSFILPFISEAIKAKKTAFKDYKTLLQEIIQQNPGEEISYMLIDEQGPEHEKRFTVEVRLNSNVIGKGEGSSKKNAEQMAAKEALELMGK